MLERVSNRPDLQEQVDDLRDELRLMRSALADVMSAMLPAFQALTHIERAAMKMYQLEERDNAESS